MWEIEVLDALQNIHTPWLDKIMVAITSLGNAGILWIVMAAVLLIIPKTRKAGLCMTIALILDLLITNCLLKNLVARTRPYDVADFTDLIVKKPKLFLPIRTHGGVICGCHGVVHEQEETAGRNILCDSDPHSVLKNVSVCAFPDRYHWRNSGRRGGWSGSRIYT